MFKFYKPQETAHLLTGLTNDIGHFFNDAIKTVPQELFDNCIAKNI